MPPLLRIDGLDLSPHLRLAPGEGFDPADADHIEPQFSTGALGEGDPLISIREGNRELAFPVHLSVPPNTDGVTTNLVRNPNFESPALVTGWTASHGSGTPQFFDSDTAWSAVGSRALRMHTSAVPTADNIEVSMSDFMPVIPGRKYSVHAVARVDAAPASATNIYQRVLWYDASQALITFTDSGGGSVAGFASKVIRPRAGTGETGSFAGPAVTAPVGAAYAKLSYIIDNASGAAATIAFRIDAVGFYDRETLPLWGCGDSPGGFWNGVPGASTSTIQVVPRQNLLHNPRPWVRDGFGGITRRGWRALSNITSIDAAVRLEEDTTSPTGAALVFGADASTDMYVQNGDLTVAEDASGGGSTTRLQYHVLPGDWVTLSAWTKMTSEAAAGVSNASLAASMAIGDRPAGGSAVFTVASYARSTAIDKWIRISVTRQVPVDSSAVLIRVYGRGSSVAGAEVRYAGFALARGRTQAEAERNAATFFDGDDIHGEWAGTRRVSFSHGHTGKDGLHAARGSMESVLRNAKLIEWRDENASRSTFLDAHTARFEADYSYRKAARLWLSGIVRAWTKPYATTGSYRPLSSDVSIRPAATTPLTPMMQGDVPAFVKYRDVIASVAGLGSQVLDHALVGYSVLPPGYQFHWTPSQMTAPVGSSHVRTTDTNSGDTRRSTADTLLDFVVPKAQGTVPMRLLVPMRVDGQAMASAVLHVAAHAVDQAGRMLGPTQIATYSSWTNHVPRQLSGDGSEIPGGSATGAWQWLDLGVLRMSPLVDSTVRVGFGIASQHNGANIPAGNAASLISEVAGAYLLPEDATTLVSLPGRSRISGTGFAYSDNVRRIPTQVGLEPGFTYEVASGATQDVTGRTRGRMPTVPPAPGYQIVGLAFLQNRRAHVGGGVASYASGNPAGPGVGLYTPSRALTVDVLERYAYAQ